tara:strand:+ start:24167 stop:24937 length:771 start_codon:yes stop_codon:yes gene_type:complete
MRAWFTPGACQTPRDIRSQIASLYFTYAVDVLTDLMGMSISFPCTTPNIIIAGLAKHCDRLHHLSDALLTSPTVMALPTRLIWDLQMPRAQKGGITGLFGIGIILIAVATLRVAQIGGKAQSSSQPSASWLALWGVIETSIAVIIGCCPTFVILIRNHTTPAVSYNTQGFVRQREGGNGKGSGPGPDSVKLNSIAASQNGNLADASTKSTSSKEAGWEDANDSQYDLVVPPRDIVEEVVEDTPMGKKRVRVRRGAR